MDEAWETFQVSGKITDYLKFKNVECGELKAGGSMFSKQEERADGTEYYSDRDGLKCNADWRL